MNMHQQKRFAGIVSIATVMLAMLPIIASATPCPNLSRNLSFGSRGQAVVELQQFLILQNLLAAGNNTGYFGKLTQAAVQQWQKKNGIVSSGTPATTGYGSVGPRTRAMIRSRCSTTQESSANGTQTSPGLSYTPPPGDTATRNTIPQEAPAPLRDGVTPSLTSQSCTPLPSQTQTLSCPQGQTGSITQTRTSSCPGPAWSEWVTASNSCHAPISSPPSSCLWYGQIVASGASITAYQSSSVISGQSCASQQRTCTNGSWSGVYPYPSCRVAPLGYSGAFQILTNTNQINTDEAAQASRLKADGVWAIAVNSTGIDWKKLFTDFSADVWAVAENNPSEVNSNTLNDETDAVSQNLGHIVDGGVYYSESNSPTIVDAEISDFASHITPTSGSLGPRVVVLVRGYTIGSGQEEDLKRALAKSNVAGVVFEFSPWGIATQLNIDTGCKYALSLNKKCYFLMPPSPGHTTDYLSDVKKAVQFFAQSGGILNNQNVYMVPAIYVRPNIFHYLNNGPADHNSLEAVINWLRAYRTDQHRKPRGSVDGATCESVWGWAQDEDTFDMPSDVHFYIDGQFAGSMTASAYRSDLCSIYGSCYHGFTWNIPAQFKAPGQHGIAVYGIDMMSDANNTELPHSPKYYQCN